MQNDNVKTYGQWQFEKGSRTIELYTKKYTVAEMFEGKNVLDIGCGAGGKTLYYASQGAARVVGVDVVPRYEQQAKDLAKDLGLEEKFDFVLADAAKLPFEEDSFDTIIMNDAMEHVDKPEEVLAECLRVLVRGGRLFVNFPPYNHPYGAHLSDAIGVPWVHLFFGEKTLIDGYKKLVKDLPDGRERIDFRITTRAGGEEYFSYINKMSVKRFKKLIHGHKVVYYKEEPLRGFLAPLARLPVLKEFFTKMVVCVVEK